MSAPLDIGLEQQDGHLYQDDIFDLEDAERKTGGRQSVSKLIGQTGEDVSSDEDENNEEAGGEADIVESDEEGARMRALESELDGLYDAYKQKRNERDAKFRAKEARKAHEKEEWRGLSKGEGDAEEDSESDEREEGGWDKMMKAKDETVTSSSEDSSDESESDGEAESRKPRKRKAETEPIPSTKKARLVSNLNGNASSRSAQMWFDQDVFKDVDLNDIEDGEESQEIMSDEEGSGDEMTAGEDEEPNGEEVSPVSTPFRVLLAYF